MIQCDKRHYDKYECDKRQCNKRPYDTKFFTAHYFKAAFKRMTQVLVVATLPLVVFGCAKSPPDNRAPVTQPVYSGGDSVRGKQLFEDNCSQCHKLKPGSNHKGPQLVGVYGSPSAVLSDYKYSEAMANANLVWDAKTLDTYIADPIAMIPETRMEADPMPNATDRQDIIAYLSTLGRAGAPNSHSTQSPPTSSD